MAWPLQLGFRGVLLFVWQMPCNRSVEQPDHSACRHECVRCFCVNNPVVDPFNALLGTNNLYGTDSKMDEDFKVVIELLSAD